MSSKGSMSSRKIHVFQKKIHVFQKNSCLPGKIHVFHKNSCLPEKSMSSIIVYVFQKSLRLPQNPGLPENQCLPEKYPGLPTNPCLPEKIQIFQVISVFHQLKSSRNPCLPLNPGLPIDPCLPENSCLPITSRSSSQDMSS